MDPKTMISIIYPAAVAIAALGCAIGLSIAVNAAMKAISRQPEAAGSIQTTMTIGAAFIEALTIYALITVVLWKLFVGA